MASKDKKESPATLSAGGKGHRVYKKEGKVIVDHVGKNNGKWDKINLTDKAGSKTVKQGVKAVKKWHSTKSHKKAK
jgi:hypothetical protein